MEVLRTFDQECLNAADNARRTLITILQDNADTEYGKKYHFADISSVSEYKKQVPFSTFEDYEDFVSEMMQGKENLLTAYPVSFYAHTSGTLGAAKHIPYTEKAEEIVHRYASIDREAYEETLSGKLPHMPSEPKMLYLATAREDHAKDGTLITNFSGKFLLEYREVLKQIAVQLELIFCDVEMDLMYLFAFYALREKNLICIRTPFMAAVSDFFCYIEKHWEDLCRDIEEGVLRPSARTSSILLKRLSTDLQPDPKRAMELRKIFHRGFDRPVAADVWPSICYVQAIGGSAFSAYTAIVRRFTGEIPIHMSVYAASEGLFGIAVRMNSPEYVIVPDSGYYEFIPEEAADLPEEALREHTLEIHQLKPGKKYEMVVTNLSGLYRYRIGDVVIVNGYLGQAPVICFSYRRHQVLNITGEKTHEDMIQYAMNSLKKYAGINIVEWSACADYSTSPARYLLFIEAEPEIEHEKKQEIRDLLDEKLAEASEYYAHYRQEKKLGPLELILLQPQTFALYRDVQVWNGASPNQLKPIHVITNPKTEAFFRGLKIST